MSMRDFITRVLNTPVVVGTPSPIVVEIPPTIVVETHFDPPSPRKGSSKNDVPFYWDIESRSAAVLGSGKQGVGARAYAEHPTTEVLCVSYARGDGPIETWVPGQPIPEVATAAAVDPRSPWAAHGAAFERAMLERILVPLHGWPMVPVNQHVYTMSLALAHAYPGSLEAVAKMLGLANPKDVAREKIVRVMWKPRKPRRGEDPTKLYWVDSPELRAELYLYNRHDVATERELHQHPHMRALPALERDTWVLDAEINDHGIGIDVPLPRRGPGSRRGLSPI
jgi:DNA polymerase